MDEPLDILALQADLVARFADDVAHEIRNPLNALVINIEVLRRRVTGGDTEAALGRLDVLDQEVRRVHSIVERFIALLRPARPSEPTADVADALDDVVPLIALRAAALRSTFEGPGSIDLDVRLARDRLRFAILDAGMAALDRAGRGGHLSCVAAGDHDLCTISLRSRSAAAAGTTGLAVGEPRLARAIVREVGGTVEIVEGDGAGIEVRLSIPAVA